MTKGLQALSASQSLSASQPHHHRHHRHATCMPLPSDTFHDKLFACDQGDHGDYDDDHEEGLWLSMQPVCLCRRTPFIITFGVDAGVTHI